MTAWLGYLEQDRTVLVAMPDALGQPCWLLDEQAKRVALRPPRAMSPLDQERHFERELARFSRVDEVFAGMLRRHG